MEHNKFLVGMCMTNNEMDNDFHFFINHYIKLCDHLVVLDKNSTDGTYEALLKIEEKFRHRYTILKSIPERNDRVQLYSFAANLTPDMICDFSFGVKVDERINYNTMLSICNLLESLKQKAALINNHMCWLHEKFYYEGDKEHGDFLIANDNDEYAIPSSISEKNTMYILMPEYYKGI